MLALVIVAASGLVTFAALEWFARRPPPIDWNEGARRYARRFTSPEHPPFSELAYRLRWYTLK